MQRLKRIALIGGTLTTGAVLTGSVALWIVLAQWLPTTGKARLIQELERWGPVDVSIGTLGYRPFRGFVLKEMSVVDRATQELWCAAPLWQVQVDWLKLLVSRRLAFRSRASLDAPVHTALTFSGRYHLRDKSLTLDAHTTETPVRSIGAPLTRYVPPPLKDGTVRLHVHLSHSPHQPPDVAVRLEGTRLIWKTPGWSLSGDLAMEGMVTPPSPGGRWAFQGDAALSHATLDGLSVVGPITDIEGRSRVTPELIDIQQLTATGLGSSWTLEGTVTTGATPSVEMLVRSRANLATLVDAFPTLKSAWQPEGTADVEAVCRGPLHPSLLLDCLARAELRNATLASAKLAQPLTGITGRLRYDLLTHTLSIDQLTGRLMDDSLTLSGEMDVKDPVGLHLHVSGTVPLEAAIPWFPPKSPVRTLGGAAALDLEISGSSAAPRATGTIELREASAQLTAPAITLERVTGSVRLADDRLTVSEATLTLNGEPLTLDVDAALVPEAIPRLTATVGFRQGRLSLTARVGPQEVLIDDAQLSLERTELRGRGTVGLGVDQASRVDLSGTVDFTEITRLPFVPLPHLDAWRLQGSGVIEAKFRGRFSDVPAATIESRLRADRLSVRDLPLEQLTATLEQNDGVTRIRVPSGLCAGGKCWGELVVEHRSSAQPATYVLQADVVSLQLATLAQAIPAWRSRSVRGSASTHALLSGTWAHRATWRGEGWLNAEGQGLGDLPLLDKVFRGLVGALADRLGLETLRRAQITQASVRWRLSQERIQTEDLRLGGLAGTEPVGIYAKGSVGLDKTLDFVIEPELSEGVVLQAPTTSSLASTVLQAAGQLERLRRLIGRHRLTGTLDHPEYRFELSTQEIFKQLAPGPGDLIQQLLDAVRKPAP